VCNSRPCEQRGMGRCTLGQSDSIVSQHKVRAGVTKYLKDLRMYNGQSVCSNRRGSMMRQRAQIAEAPASSALADTLALALQKLG